MISEDRPHKVAIIKEISQHLEKFITFPDDETSLGPLVKVQDRKQEDFE